VLTRYCGHIRGIRWQGLWGKSIHNFNLESHGGAHLVALEAVFEMKTQAEAKLHMYCLF
jgi:hypothetical protein